MSWLDQFIAQQSLAESYTEAWEDSYAQVADWVLAQVRKHKREFQRPYVLGIHGSQGSGKSTLSSAMVHYFESVHKICAVYISLDDVYYPRSTRQHLAQEVHALLATRGVPGTHDIDLLLETLQSLEGQSGEVLIPRFDKANDDRAPQSNWDKIELPVDLIILEGWCLGASPQTEADLIQPCNELERFQDTEGVWRRYANDCLRESYPQLYARIDSWLMLQAPSFDAVLSWRTEQEDKLRSATQGLGTELMSESELANFVQYFQRLTEHCLNTLPSKVDLLIRLDRERRVKSIAQNLGLEPNSSSFGTREAT